MSSYDQWLTTPPNDDYDDDHCYYCGAYLPDDITDIEGETLSAIEDGYCSPDCLIKGKDGSISPQYGLPHATDAQKLRAEALRERLNKHEFTPRTIDPLRPIGEAFSLPEGDFNWTDNEASDWHVYNCGERDCPAQWHLVSYATNIKRVDGVLTIELHSVDSDGNWDFDAGWTEGEDFYLSGVESEFNGQSLNDYFRGWAEYWLDVAETGKDVCDQMNDTPQDWVGFCLDAAETDIKYLEM